MLVQDSGDDSLSQQELGEFLKAMVPQGTVSSSGIFTIDVKAALPKLEKFQLPKPYFGILKIIQSAVSSMASYVEAYSSTTGLIIEHNGAPPTPEQLKNLLSYLLTTDQNQELAPLRDLAIGLNTSLARGASWVEITVRTEGGWATQRWASREDSALSELSEQASIKKRHNVRFAIRNSVSQITSGVWSRVAKKDIMGMLTGSRDYLDSDVQIIFDRCRFSPIDIKINGKRLPQTAISGVVIKRWSLFTVMEHRKGNLIEVYLQCDQEAPYLLSIPSGSPARFKYMIQGTYGNYSYTPHTELLTITNEPQSRSCFAILGIRPQIHSPGEIILIKNGVELTRLTPPTFPAGFTAIISAEGLKLDLSQFRLVDTPEFHNRMTWLTNLAFTTIGKVLQTTDNSLLSPSELEYFANSTQRKEQETGLPRP